MPSRARVLVHPLALATVLIVLALSADHPSAAQPVPPPPPLADLAVVELSVAPAMGGLRTVRLLQFRQVNLGPGASPATTTCLTVTRIDASIITISRPVNVPELLAGDVYSDTWAFTLDAPGDFQAAVVADCDAVVMESSEVNNIAAARLSAAPAPLELLTTELPRGIVGQPYATNLSAVGDALPLTYSGSTPPGLVLQSDGVLIGVPTVPGRFSVEVRVVDGIGRTVGAELALEITEEMPLSVVTTELPPADVGQPYCAPEATLRAVGGSPPYTWTAVSTLPDGLRLSADGVLCGLPTTIGRATFEVEVRDQLTAARAQVGLDVRPAPLVVDTTPLTARAGELSSARVLVSGGVPPYTFLKAEGLPAGLALEPSGALIGVPAAAGRATLSVTVVDTYGVLASAAIELTIAARASTSTPELELADPAGCACDTTSPGDLGLATLLFLAAALVARGRRWAR